MSFLTEKMGNVVHVIESLPWKTFHLLGRQKEQKCGPDLDISSDISVSLLFWHVQSVT